MAAGLASQCQIQISYAIGIAQPTSIAIDTFGTGKVDEEKLIEIVRSHFDLRPKGIIQMLDLQRPIYSKTAAYGHFGREDPSLPGSAPTKPHSCAPQQTSVKRLKKPKAV